MSTKPSRQVGITGAGREMRDPTNMKMKKMAATPKQTESRAGR